MTKCIICRLHNLGQWPQNEKKRTGEIIKFEVGIDDEVFEVAGLDFKSSFYSRPSEMTPKGVETKYW